MVYAGIRGLSGRVLDSGPRGRRFQPYWRHCLVSLSKNINPSLVLVQPRKTLSFITERLLMGRKESNQTKQTKCWDYHLQQENDISVYMDRFEAIFLLPLIIMVMVTRSFRM